MRPALLLAASLAFAAGAGAACLTLWLLRPSPPPSPEPASGTQQILTHSSREQLQVDGHSIDVDPLSSVVVARAEMTGKVSSAPLVVLLHGSAGLRAAARLDGPPLLARVGNIEVRARSALFQVALRGFEGRVDVKEGTVTLLSAAGTRLLEAGKSWPEKPATESPKPGAAIPTSP